MTALSERPAEAAEPVAHGHQKGRDFGPVRWLPRIAVLGVVAYWILVAIPRSESYAPYAADAVIFALVGLSLNIIIGYTGQLSLGHQGFLGLGAFAAAYSLTELDVAFGLTFVIAAGTAAAFALLLGFAALRITGLYLALITLVFGLTLKTSLFEVPRFTNGGAGQPADRPEWLFDDGKFYLFCLAFLVVVFYLDWRLTKTKTGRALLALKENERVAEAFGVNVTAFKLFAFVFSGAIAGLAGALYAYRIGNVVGDDFSFALALTFVLMVVVGGLGSRIGVVLGATLFATLDTYLLEQVGPIHKATEFVFRTPNLAQYDAQFLGALGLLLTIVLNPGGIAQQIRPITNWLAGKPFSLHGDEDSGPASVEGSSVRA